MQGKRKRTSSVQDTGGQEKESNNKRQKMPTVLAQTIRYLVRNGFATEAATTSRTGPISHSALLALQSHPSVGERQRERHTQIRTKLGVTTPLSAQEPGPPADRVLVGLTFSGAPSARTEITYWFESVRLRSLLSRDRTPVFLLGVLDQIESGSCCDDDDDDISEYDVPRTFESVFEHPHEVAVDLMYWYMGWTAVQGLSRIPTDCDRWFLPRREIPHELKLDTTTVLGRAKAEEWLNSTSKELDPPGFRLTGTLPLNLGSNAYFAAIKTMGLDYLEVFSSPSYPVGRVALNRVQGRASGEVRFIDLINAHSTEALLTPCLINVLNECNTKKRRSVVVFLESLFFKIVSLGCPDRIKLMWDMKVAPRQAWANAVDRATCVSFKRTMGVIRGLPSLAEFSALCAEAVNPRRKNAVGITTKNNKIHNPFRMRNVRDAVALLRFIQQDGTTLSTGKSLREVCRDLHCVLPRCATENDATSYLSFFPTYLEYTRAVHDETCRWVFVMDEKNITSAFESRYKFCTTASQMVQCVEGFPPCRDRAVQAEFYSKVCVRSVAAFVTKYWSLALTKRPDLDAVVKKLVSLTKICKEEWVQARLVGFQAQLKING